MRDLLALWEDPAVPVVLRSTVTSPFGRKVRIAAEVTNLAHRIERHDADTLDPGDTLRLENPLGKMPCLLIGEHAIYDSSVTLELLDLLSGGSLIPPAGLERFEALTMACLADGIAEAALLMVYEARFREEGAPIGARWCNHQSGKIARGLSAFEAAPPAASAGVAGISLACALGYLDWRQPVAWRENHPGLVAWLNAFSAATPAFHRTERSAS